MMQSIPQWIKIALFTFNKVRLNDIKDLSLIRLLGPLPQQARARIIFIPTIR
jgi:hypothetical protein